MKIQPKCKAAPVFATARARKIWPGQRVTNLSDFPNELLLLVVNHIKDTSETDGPLITLCLVNRRFSNLVAPILWGEVSFDTGEVPSFLLFLSTIIWRPDLALRTKVFKWSLCRNRKDDADFQGVKDFDAIAQTIKGFAVPHETRWLEHLELYDPDAFIAVALVSIANITCLDSPPINLTTLDSIYPSTWLEHLLSSARGTPFPEISNLSHFSEVALVFNATVASHISPLLKLPSLRRLHFTARDDKPGYVCATSHLSRQLELWNCQPRTSPITKWAINADVPWGIIDVMMRSCASLHRFWFENSVWLKTEPLWLRNVGESLLQHQHSLSHVSLNGARYDILLKDAHDL